MYAILRSWRRSLGLTGVLLTVALAALGAPAPAVDAQSSPGSILSPSTNPYGRSYGEWSRLWWQWAASIPANEHPLIDKGPCNVGQSGPVWFLGGSFIPGTHVRSCTVPNGTALFIPLVNFLDDNIGRPPPLFNEAQLRAEAASIMDGASGLSAQVDGRSIPGLTAKGQYRVQSPTAFSYILPPNSVFCYVGACPPYLRQGQTVPLAVADGIFIMVAPLPPGQHVVRITGALPAFNFSLDTTNNITVTP